MCIRDRSRNRTLKNLQTQAAEWSFWSGGDGASQKTNQHHRRWSGWLAGEGGVHLRVWRDLAKSGRSRWPETRFQRAKHLQHSGEVGAPCGSSGDGWGGAGGSATADLGICNAHRRNSTFANFCSCSPENGRARAAQTRHLLSHSGGKADGEEFELSLRV